MAFLRRDDDVPPVEGVVGGKNITGEPRSGALWTAFLEVNKMKAYILIVISCVAVSLLTHFNAFENFNLDVFALNVLPTLYLFVMVMYIIEAKRRSETIPRIGFGSLALMFYIASFRASYHLHLYNTTGYNTYGNVLPRPMAQKILLIMAAILLVLTLLALISWYISEMEYKKRRRLHKQEMEVRRARAEKRIERVNYLIRVAAYKKAAEEAAEEAANGKNPYPQAGAFT